MAVIQFEKKNNKKYFKSKGNRRFSLPKLYCAFNQINAISV